MYEKMYYILFNAITDAMEKMDWLDYQGAMTRLEMACREAEELYIMQAPDLTDSTEAPPPIIYCPRFCLQDGEDLDGEDLAQLGPAWQDQKKTCFSP